MRHRLFQACNLALAQLANLRSLLTEPLFVPANMTALKLLETFKQTRKHLALVPDEFGTMQGQVQPLKPAEPNSPAAESLRAPKP